MNRGLYDLVKRAMDVVAATTAIALSLPLLISLALLIRCKLGSPVLFRQVRPGRDEKLFELMKFRTMLEPDAERGLVSDDQRLNRLGIFLRSTSLDELPSLWNVLKGDLSMVGPRPLLVRYLVRYTPEQRRRHDVKPGITGLAQVNGRNALTWNQKFALDLRYVESRSLLLDLRIVIWTIGRVIRREGISFEGQATMPEFKGSRDE